MTSSINVMKWRWKNSGRFTKIHQNCGIKRVLVIFNYFYDIIFSLVSQRNAPYSNCVSVNVNVNKRRMNINITALCGLPEGVKAVFNGRKFDHVNQSNRRKFINCIRIGFLLYIFTLRHWRWELLSGRILETQSLFRCNSSCCYIDLMYPT